MLNNLDGYRLVTDEEFIKKDSEILHKILSNQYLDVDSEICYDVNK